MRRLFWMSVGAAAGYYAARKGSAAVEQARERGLVGNVTLAASTATKVVQTASRTTVALGETVGSRARALADGRASADRPAADAGQHPGSAPTTSTSSREVRP
ncbi:MAG TPA: hypothetical protein VLV82_00175 [Candidatus Angelobacter sp.]|nr:hypothetical protein [Candidatus Angelobacter sp.]